LKVLKLKQIQEACPSKWIAYLDNGEEKLIYHRLSYPFNEDSKWYLRIYREYPEIEIEFEDVAPDDLTAIFETFTLLGYSLEETEIDPILYELLEDFYNGDFFYES
jgi:hypothetical protein